MGTTKSGARKQSNSKSAEPAKRFCTSAFQLSRSAHDHGSKTGRFEAASNLLRHVLRLPNEPPLAGHIESWNVAESGERNFEREMPLWVRRDSDPILICYLSLLALRNVCAPKQSEHIHRTPLSNLAWAHFLMGYAPRKPILQVDLSGSDSLKDSAEIHLGEENQGDEPQIVQVRLSAAFLNQVRANHTRTLQSLHHSSATCLDQLSRPTDPRPAHSYREYVLTNVVDVVRKNPPSVSEDQVALLLGQIEKSASFQTLLAGLGPIFRTADNPERTKAFIRQMLVQAVLYPKDGPPATVAFLPDISHQDVRTESQTSSTATQLFLSEPLRLNDPLWQMWSALVSLTGREKSVHDFSRRAEKIAIPKGEFVPAHEMDSPVGILYNEYEKLSAEGQFALDFLELLRRYAKRDWSDALPATLDASFSSTAAFIEKALLLGHRRALLRNVAPKQRKGGKVEHRLCADLLKNHRFWLKYSISIPEQVVASRARWACQVKAWLLFLVAASCHHAIKYAFRDCATFDDWETAQGIKHADIEVSALEKDDHTLAILVTNTGDSKPPEALFSNEFLMPIHSNELGDLRLPEVDGKSVVVRSFHSVLNNADKNCPSWIAEILVLPANDPKP